jgi:hypothetical protein
MKRISTIRRSSICSTTPELGAFRRFRDTLATVEEVPNLYDPTWPDPTCPSTGFHRYSTPSRATDDTVIIGGPSYLEDPNATISAGRRATCCGR